MPLHNGNDTDSGVFYLVNNRNGKRFVRRPNPPPTSPPLDEDFDAITQDCTTTKGVGGDDEEELDRVGERNSADEINGRNASTMNGETELGVGDGKNGLSQSDEETAFDPDDTRGRRSTWAPTTPVDDNFDAWTYQTQTAFTGVPVEVGVPTNAIGKIFEEDRYDDGSWSWKGDPVDSTRKVDKGKGREVTDNGHERERLGSRRQQHHSSDVAGPSSSTRTSRTRDQGLRNGNGYGHSYGQGQEFSHHQTYSPSRSPTTLTLTRTTSNRNHRPHDDRRGTLRNGTGKYHVTEPLLRSRNDVANAPSSSTATYRRPRNPERNTDYHRPLDVGLTMYDDYHRSGQNPNHHHQNRLELVKSPNPYPRRNERILDEFGRLGSPTRRNADGIANPALRRRGPLPAAQNYEVVNSQVLEDGPERTVTISTWREQVANEARRSEVEMSVYFVNADEYAVEGLDDEALALYNKGTGRKEGGGEKGKKDRKKDKLTAARVGELRKLGMTDVVGGSLRGSRNGSVEPGPSRNRNGISNRPQTPWPSLSELDEYEGEDESPNPRPATDVYHKSKRKPSALTLSHYHENGYNDTEFIYRRTSTPIRGVSHSPLRSPRSPRPSRERVLSPLFNPTRSGSLISTIRNQSPGSSSDPNSSSSNLNGRPRRENGVDNRITPALSLMLRTCKPPLLHLSPTLAELGITTEEHLKAVGMLKEATRDRELKEEALKRGVTIMEWAILLDMLQAL